MPAPTVSHTSAPIRAPGGTRSVSPGALHGSSTPSFASRASRALKCCPGRLARPASGASPGAASPLPAPGRRARAEVSVAPVEGLGVEDVEDADARLLRRRAGLDLLDKEEAARDVADEREADRRLARVLDLELERRELDASRREREAMDAAIEREREKLLAEFHNKTASLA